MAKQFIDGNFVESNSNETIEVLNPADDQQIGEVAKGNEEDVKAAVAGAVKAQKNWAQVNRVRRAEIVLQLADQLQEHLEKHAAWGIQVTSDPVEIAKLIKLRQDMLPAVFAKGKYHIMEDMAVPLSKLAEMADYITQVGEELSVDIYTAGHAGDSNLHPSLLWDEQEEAPERVVEAIRLLFHRALDLGGTISGEHAVGMSKNQWNNVELGGTVDRIQHQLKNLFDPMNIMNPKRKIN